MSEEALLLAVRDTLREKCGFKPAECDIEYDEMAPVTVGQRYIVVMSGGWDAGPNNGTGGGVLDELFSVDVAVAVRSSSTPRDRLRNLFTINLGNVNSICRLIIASVGMYSYDVQNLANQYIGPEANGAEGFIEPLKFGAMGKPQAVGPEFFGADPDADGPAGLMRVVHLVGARRIQTVEVAH